MKILIADADADAARVLRQKLEELHDIQVKEAHCGTDAWMILTTFREGFDAAIMDLALPDMEGIELLKRMRRLPKLQAIPVIVFTAVRDRTNVTSTLALGVRHYIVKPAPAEIVQAKLLDALGGARRR